jgi:hypothetical protein
MSKDNMTLYEMSYACRLYNALTDTALEDMYKRIGSKRIDMGDDTHLGEVLKWLNKWQCRQFALAYHCLAKKNLSKWATKWSKSLPSFDEELVDFSEEQLMRFAEAFDALSDSIASKRGAKKYPVTVGPTGAAKIFFVLRPKAFLPWDSYIRELLGFGCCGKEYMRFLIGVAGQIQELINDAKRLGIKREQIPIAVNRPDSTLAKLMDEYHWVSITRACKAPSADVLEKWVQWQVAPSR